MKHENIYTKVQKMIVMDIRLDNFMSFENFHMNMSYPKRIVDSYIENEHLLGYPNFRYKKVNVLMGANATGKTSFGKMMMRIFNFMDNKQYERMAESITDCSKEASFSMDFITDKPVLYRIDAMIMPKTDDKYKNSDIKIGVKHVEIKKKDNYESCKKRLDELPGGIGKNYIEELEKTHGLSWRFEYPSDSQITYKVHKAQDSKKYLAILEFTLKALDPSIKKVEKIKGVENSFIIRMAHTDVIIQNGKIVDANILSSGTKSGIEVAGFLSSIINKENSFYYCDEKFSYVHSDIEKAFLALMIQSLQSNDQLFFTTHNTDVLDLKLPKHSFTFLIKNLQDESEPVKCISASDYLKRNTDSLRNAVENDLFSSAPSVELIYEIANL